MQWSDIGKTVASVAPVLAGVLGGPAGVVAGAAGALIGSFLGVEPEPAAVSRALADPQTLVRLKELELQHQARLLDWQDAQLKAELANVQGARAREVDLARAGHGAAWATSIVSVVVTLGFFVMLGLVLTDDREQLNEASLLLLGSLSMAFGAVVNYYLGSSSGSTAKSQQIAQLKAER